MIEYGKNYVKAKLKKHFPKHFVVGDIKSHNVSRPYMFLTTAKKFNFVKTLKVGTTNVYQKVV